MRHSILAIAVLLTLTGCGKPGETLTPAPAPVVEAPKFTAATQAKTVGAAGGALTLTAADSTIYSLTIPAGALSKDTVITLTTLKPGPGQLFRLKLEPDGLMFLGGKKAALTITLPAGVTLPAGGGFLYSGTTLPFTRNPDGTFSVELSSLLKTASAMARLDTGRMLAAAGDFLLSAAYAAAAACGGPPVTGSDGEGLSAEEALDLEIYTQCMRAAISNLEANGNFESAARAHAAIAALINLVGSSGDATSATHAAGADACRVYNDRLATNDSFPLDESSTLDDVKTLRGLIAQMLYWRTVVLQLGADCSSVLDFDTVMQDKSRQISDYYQSLRSHGNLDNSASATFRGAVEQYQSLTGLSDEAAALGVPAATRPITMVAQPRMSDDLIAGAATDCRNNGSYGGLIQLMQALNGEPKVASSAQYCGTKLSSEFTDSSGTPRAAGPLLGGSADGAPVTSGTIQVAKTGTLKLTGPIAALACPNGAAGDEELALTLNGVEVQRLSNSPYLPSALSFDLANLITQSGLDPEHLSTHPLTITRTGNACGGFWGSNPSPLLTLTLSFGICQPPQGFDYCITPLLDSSGNPAPGRPVYMNDVATVVMKNDARFSVWHEGTIAQIPEEDYLPGGINHDGVIPLTHTYQTTGRTITEAAVWRDGVVSLLPNSNAVATYAWGINDAGSIVGTTYFIDTYQNDPDSDGNIFTSGTGNYVATLWSSGGVSFLSPRHQPGNREASFFVGLVNAVNASGLAVGSYEQYVRTHYGEEGDNAVHMYQHAEKWSSGAQSDIFPASRTEVSVAVAVDDFGATIISSGDGVHYSYRLVGAPVTVTPLALGPTGLVFTGTSIVDTQAAYSTAYGSSLVDSTLGWNLEGTNREIEFVKLTTNGTVSPLPYFAVAFDRLGRMAGIAPRTLNGSTVNTPFILTPKDVKLP